MTESSEVKYEYRTEIVEFRSWVEVKEYGVMVGMGSKTVYDSEGKIVSHEITPTGCQLRLGD